VSAEFRGNDRFDVVRTLGRGGMGVVYEAVDLERGARVAVKTLPALDGELLLRLKNEFRAVHELAHPNLVGLGELFEDAGTWFFTMELVDGVDFLRWVRHEEDLPASEASAPTAVSDEAASARTNPATPHAQLEAVPVAAAAPTRPPADPVRLRDALRQLAVGLAALHDAGRVHRDIKPSNVLVTSDGRVVILDFGLIARSREAVPAGVLIGTIPYLAPESVDAAPSPAADCYSMGVIAYEALTGSLPIAGQGLDAMVSKRTADVEPPSARVAGVPADLEALCLALLARDPAQRPTAREVANRLGAALDEGRTARFVGRAAELALLDEALAASRDGARAVVVRGPSGIGKTALIQSFAAAAAESGAVVLAGRCHERETVPFRALDGVIDALSDRLTVDPERLPAVAGLAAAAAVFPVLQRVPGIGDAGVSGAPDRLELRRRATAALRAQLAALAHRHPVIVTIDDAQWADADSLALLADIVRAPDEPRMLLVATSRGGETVLGTPTRVLELGGLAPRDVRSLATQLSGDLGDDRGDEIVAASGGLPLFVAELARHAGTARGRSLDDALWARARALDDEPRRLLEVIAIGGRLATTVALRAAGLAATSGDRTLAVLRAARLARLAGSGRGERVEPFHDRVREAITARLGSARCAEIHVRLADALDDLAPGEHEARARHLREAGRTADAATQARLAAGAADRALAFDRAAELWRDAIELGGADREALVGLADALVAAGRGAEAGDAYARAAAIAPHDDALHLEALAAEQYLHAGHLESGLRVLARALAAAGLRLPATPRQALPGLIVRRARVRLRGLAWQERPADAARLATIDLCWSVATGLALVDHFRGADFQARHLLRALDAGEPYRVARALMLEACYSATGGSRTAARTAEVLAAARVAADRAASPHAIALVEHAAAVDAFCAGRFAEALASADRCQELLRTTVPRPGWGLNDAQMFALHALAIRGDLGELLRRLPAHRAEAEARGNLWALTNFSIGSLGLDALVADDPALARRRAADLLARWRAPVFLFQNAMEVYLDALADLYEGDAAGCTARLAAATPPLRRSLLLDVQILRAQFTELGGRCALARGDVAGARAAARRLAREHVPWIDALAAALSALADGTVAALHAAEARLEAVDLGLHARALRRRRGELAGDVALIHAVDTELRAVGVVRPDRLLRAFAPQAAAAAATGGA